MNLPVIVGFGGINCGGRSSNFRSYERTVYDALNDKDKKALLHSLASLMGKDADSPDEASILSGTLVRKLEGTPYNPAKTPGLIEVSVDHSDGGQIYSIPRRDMTPGLELDFEIVQGTSENENILLKAKGSHKVQLAATQKLQVSAAGIFPDGFDPGSGYKSRNHPRGIKAAIYGASDAIFSSGLSPEALTESVPYNMVGVYAASSLGQGDSFGFKGYCVDHLLKGRPSSKQLPFSMPQMTADFINSYVIGNIGKTMGLIGACATFAYNLGMAVEDIKAGRTRLAIVGSSEAPLTPEIMSAYDAMSALAKDSRLQQLDNLSSPDMINFARACRPFADNCGFVMSESAQFLILTDPETAVKLGANIYGSVPVVHINADGYKGSISKPGLGNFVSFGSAARSVEKLTGSEGLKHRSLVYAHGTGTPQNRVSESMILSKTAKAFGIEKWPVVGVKGFLGHPTGPAAGDQINNALGIWKHGILPGLLTSSSIADDVHNECLDFFHQHKTVDPKGFDSVLINSKGFGGNNATAVILSPDKTMEFVSAKFDTKEYYTKREKTLEAIENNDAALTSGKLKPIYKPLTKEFEDTQTEISREGITDPSLREAISLETDFDF